MSGNNERRNPKDGDIVWFAVHVGRHCAVMYRRFGPGFEFHNGYVSILGHNSNITYDDERILNLETASITYIGDLSSLTGDTSIMIVVGFDTAHAWNDLRPETKTFQAVQRKTMELAEELVRKGI